MGASDRTKKKQWGTTPRSRKCRDFDAMYYMGSTTAVGESPVPSVIRALMGAMCSWPHGLLKSYMVNLPYSIAS